MPDTIKYKDMPNNAYIDALSDDTKVNQGVRTLERRYEGQVSTLNHGGAREYEGFTQTSSVLTP